jgi:multiple sugar transport system substrate-binding protein
MELSGFAVNKKAGAANENALKQVGQPNGSGPKQKIMMNGKELTPKPAEQQDIDRIEKALNGIRAYAESDPKITAIVAEESAPFFQGQKSAEETAKVIQNKVSTYLRE